MYINKIAQMLRNTSKLESNSPLHRFPPTLLFNEGWMLRLVLDYYSSNRNLSHQLSFMANSKCYSELLLPSPFSPRYRGDKLGEGYTHADGVIGHFTIQNKGKGDIKLEDGVKQFKVIEAKMYSPLSKGTSNCPYYNQAARNVACMAEVIRRNSEEVSSKQSEEIITKQLESLDLAFYVIAPKEQKTVKMTSILEPDSIKKCVDKRVLEYQEQPEYAKKKAWFEEVFIPVWETMKINKKIDFISWESILDDVEKNDKQIGNSLKTFYEECKKNN